MSSTCIYESRTKISSGSLEGLSPGGLDLFYAEFDQESELFNLQYVIVVL